VNVGRRIVRIFAAISTISLLVLILLAYRQPALLLDFLNIVYCG
jgi:hypothetical protein